MIRLSKIPTRPQQENIILQAADLSQDVNLALERNFRIIQLDEFLVSKGTLPKYVWTLPKMNAILD